MNDISTPIVPDNHEEVIDQITKALLTPASLELHGFGEGKEFGTPPPEDQIRSALRTLIGFVGSTRIGKNRDGSPGLVMLNIVPTERVELTLLPHSGHSSMLALFKPTEMPVSVAIEMIESAAEVLREVDNKDPDSQPVRH